ncbi:DUF1514 family protein [Staphylococcus arlettae]|uniref:DUF1514 family protein n=1 Tax=Staphylococcus arlettae TaxID=29378 RepID=UPI000D1B84E3|nr:DUF1514 family protein [Staphylococcus arlettae]PUZ30842.1 DUF1514 domain-containing protein [Staphylococcus arlettae]
MWIIISIILAVITILTLISNSEKDDEIAALKYAIVYMANDDDIEKANKEWERFKG